MDVSAPNQNRNVGSRRLRRPPAWRRRQPSTWPPDGSLALHPRPADSFLVTKAILWERGRSHNTKHVSPTHPPSLCPRFLSHMKAHRGGLAAPACCQAPTSRPDPPPPGLGCGTTLSRRPPTLEGIFDAAQNRTRNDEQKRKLEDEIQSSPVSSPHRPPENQPGPEPPVSGQNKPGLFQASPSDWLPSDVMRRDRETMNLNAPVEPSDDPDWRLETSRDETEGFGSPTSSVGRPSFSDFSRPTSSLFSRSTSLASGEGSSTSDAKSEDVHPSSPQYHQETRRTSSGPGCSSTPEHRRFNTPVQLPPISSKSILGGTGCGSTEPSVEWPLDAAPPAVPSATWSSRPSPQFSAHRSGSRGGGEATPPAGGPKTRQWAVLPPISPVKGTSEVLSVEREGSWLKYEESRCSSTASRFSELSCSESHVFDELDAIAPPSTSCLSQDEPCDSSDESSAHIELSPGLAALTVGCDSGNLGSLSRVQLLLLNRADPGTLPSPPGFDEDFLREQADEDLELTSAGDLRPDSSCSVARSWSSASKVQRHKSDESDGGSCSSLVVDLSPLSRPSTCRSNFDSSDDDDDEEADENEVSPEEGKFRNRSVGIDDGGGSEEERKMDFRKTKVLNMLSRLQGGNTRRLGSNNGCSNFEDFDFLAKYCIFSPEKLDEYKRAFEREDNDADGYISCFQVLLALKNIIPAELLSDEEEIYVYRILEMVDFKVTDGLVDLRLFAVIASLAQKIATMDDFMRSLINDMDFRSLEVRLFKAKQLFLFLLEEQQEDPQQGFISSEQLLLELKAGGIHLEQEAAVRLQLQNVPPLDLLGFLAYLPLFMIIHNSVIANPLDDSRPLQVERL